MPAVTVSDLTTLPKIELPKIDLQKIDGDDFQRGRMGTIPAGP